MIEPKPITIELISGQWPRMGLYDIGDSKRFPSIGKASKQTGLSKYSLSKLTVKTVDWTIKITS